MKLIYKKAYRFATHTIWNLGRESLSRRDAFLLRTLKVIIICIRTFWEDKIAVRASALTLYTVMSIVPIAALVFAVAKGFNIEEQFRKTVIDNFSNQEEVVTWILDFAESALRNTKGGVIAGAGIIVLLWAVISMLSNVERSFNHIWNVKKPRSWIQRFSNYISLMIVIPIFFVMSSSISVTLKYEVAALERAYPFFEHISGIVWSLLKLIPYVLIWFMFTILYMVMPNTKVKFSSAFWAGVVAGTMFMIMQNLYLYSQITISKYSAIYGSFAAIPLFILWVKFSWFITLFGGTLSFANQNVDSFEYEISSDSMSIYELKIITLMVARMLAKNFEKGEKPLNAEQISIKSGIPVRAVRVSLSELEEADIIAEVVGKDDKDAHYQPAVDIHCLTVSYILGRIERLHSNENVIPQDVTSDRMVYVLAAEAAMFEESESNKLLIEL